MNALQLTHAVVSAHLSVGGVAVDATAGRGNDTAFLCRLVGETGKVWAFDIQQEAVESTRALLSREGLHATVIQASHADMQQYIAPESVDCIMFNLGYLPKGDHRIYTQFSSTSSAIEAGLRLLRPGGLISMAVYYGGDSGYAEKDALMPYLAQLPDDVCQVITVNFANWRNDPPFPAFIRKL